MVTLFRNKHKKKAYILLEVLVALIIISTTIISMTTLLASSLVRLRENETKSFVNSILVKVFENLKSENFNSSTILDSLDFLSEKNFSLQIGFDFFTRENKFSLIDVSDIGSYSISDCINNLGYSSNFRLSLLNESRFRNFDICTFISFIPNIQGRYYLVEINASYRIGSNIEDNTIKTIFYPEAIYERN